MQGSPNSKSKEIIEISYIGCTQIEKETQNIWGLKKKNYLKEFSFELKLLSSNINGLVFMEIFSMITKLIIFLKPCLKQDKFFNVNQNFVDKIGSFFSETAHKAQGEKNEIEEGKIRELIWHMLRERLGDEINATNFSTIIKKQRMLKTLQQGITIKLRANIKDINLDNLHKIEADLKEKLKQAENKEQSQIVLQAAQTEHTEQTQQATAQNTTNMQVVPVRGLFGCGVTNSGKQITRASIVVAAMRDNLSWFISFTKPFNFFNTVQFFFRYPPKLPMQKRKAITYHPEPQEQKHIGDEVDGRKRDRIASVISHFPGVGPAIGRVASYVIKKMPKNKKAEQLCQLDKSGKDQDIGQTTSHIDCFEANRKKPKVKVEQTQEQLEEKQHIIVLAQNNARLAMIDRDANQQKRTLDEIFVEIINEYKNQDSETFRNIFNSVFNVVYFQDKQLHEILEVDEVSEVLETLPIRKPINNSLLGKEYLQEIVYRKKKATI